MPSSGRLDPREVLAHLHSMGYCNITTKKLQDFIRDLKKLIEDDLQESREKENLENVPNVKVTTEVCAGAGRPGRSVCTCPHPVPEKVYRHLPSPTSTESLCSSSRSVEELPSSDEETPERQKPAKANEPSSRPQSSFIRPWRLHPPSASTAKGIPGGPTHKSDPVKMYQRYKELWSQQKIPGENNHSQLRWTIREKMLGQDPQPRPTSQASTGDHRKGIRRS